MNRPVPAPPWWRSLGCGLAMGTADAVPGVSGGTIALLLGIYTRLLDSLHDVLAALRRPLIGSRRRQALAALTFLVPLACGMLLAYYLATRLLVGSYHIPETVLAGGTPYIRAHLEAHPPAGWLIRSTTAPLVFALFFGLVLWSARVPWRARTSSHPTDPLLALAGAGAVALITLAPVIPSTIGPLILLLGGALAISAMLLPGISGSLVLLVLGLYQPVAGAVHERRFDILAWTGLGVVLGALACIPMLRWLLHRAHDRTMAVLSGLMLGSLLALWPWKTNYIPALAPHLGMHPLPPYGAWWWCVCAALLGLALAVLGERLARPKLEPCPPGG